MKSMVIPFNDDFFFRNLIYERNKNRQATILPIPKIILEIKATGCSATSLLAIRERNTNKQYKPKPITIDNSKQTPLVL